MFKKLLPLSAILLSFATSAADYQEGKHYIDLADKSFSANNQVVKVYSVNCPFCYKYEKAVIPNFENNLPDGVEYDAYHITTKPPMGLEKATVLAVAKTNSEKAYKKAKMAYYAYYHDEHKKFSTSDEAINFGIKAAGISRADYSEQANSPAVKQLLKKWDQGLDVAKLKGIPAIVVNGKYLIVTASVTSMSMLDELTADLLKK